MVKSRVKDLKPKHPLTKLCSSAEFETGASVYSNNQPIDDDNFDHTNINSMVNLYLMMYKVSDKEMPPFVTFPSPTINYKRYPSISIRYSKIRPES